MATTGPNLTWGHNSDSYDVLVSGAIVIARS